MILSNLHPDLAKLLKPVIQRSSYWAHPKVLLLAMLTDESLPTRERAMSMVLQCRFREDNKPGQVRPSHLAAVQCEPADSTQIIDWERETASKPPITLTMTEYGIRDIVHTPLSVQLTQCIHKLLGELFSWSAERLRR